MYNLNIIIPVITFGSLLISALYHTNLFYYNPSKVLKTYSVYLWLCTAFLYLENFVFKGSIETFVNDLNLSYNLLFLYFVRSTVLWLSFHFYINLVVIISEYNNIKNTLVYYITRYFWTYLFINLIFHFPSLFLSKENYYIFIILNLFFNSCIFFIVIYFLVMIFKHFKKIIKKQGYKFQMFVIFSSVSLLVFSLLTNITVYNKGLLFNLKYLSYASIGYFFEIFFFSMGISLKMKSDSVMEFEAIQKGKEQEIQLEFEKSKIAYILDNQEFKLQFESNMAVNKHKNMIGRKVHDELTGSLVALKYLISDYKHTSNSATEMYKFNNIEAEIDTIYIQTRDFSHLLIQPTKG